MRAAYSDAVRARCRDLRRAGGWPDGASGTGTGVQGSLDGGAWTRLQVHVAETTGIVDDARYRVFGCSAAVASASFVADALVGGSTDAARALDAAAVATALALPDDKRAMAALAVGAAQAAIDDWELNTGSRGMGSGAGSDTAAHPGAGQVRT